MRNIKYLPAKLAVWITVQLGASVFRRLTFWNRTFGWTGLMPGITVLWLSVFPFEANALLMAGLTLSGEDFTVSEAGVSTVTGILMKPEGNGPFPAVIISHGRGPGLSFTRNKALQMVSMGFVCIGPRYTHALDDPDFDDSTVAGSRPENLRRAGVCLRILQAMPCVRGNRIYAYGNSMGAYVTIGFTALSGHQLRASAITAGGIIPSGDAAAPTSAEADPIRTPFCMLHGEDDTTVPPSQSLLLKQVLDSHSVPNQRTTWPGVGHDLNVVKSSEVNEHIRNWFTAYGAFSPEPAKAPDRPVGLYVLDGASGTPYKGETLRDSNVRDFPFVSGYALRVAWSFVEPTQGDYDFTIIDNILTKLPAGQKLSLIIVPFEPPYIAAASDVTTWTDTDRQDNPLQRAVPWDPYLRERRRAFITALASHETGGIALRDNPKLHVLGYYLAGGFTGIRDPVGSPLHTLPGYTRPLFLESVSDELRTLTSHFPDQFVQTGFWKVTDLQSGTACWEEARQTLLEQFDGIMRPKVGFFMENLAASRPAPGGEPVTGYPVTDFAAPLYLSRDETWTAFQALTSWKAPFTGPEKVANATPMDGIAYAHSVYGAKYFELYVKDVDELAWQAGLEQWSEDLQVPQAAISNWQSYEP